MNKVHSIDTAREARDVREINELHAVQEKAIDRAIRIGELLTYYKGVVGHGNWLPWLEKNVSFSESTAQNYMRAYDGSKSPTVGDLPKAKTVREAIKPKKPRTAKTPVMKASEKLEAKGEPPLTAQEYVSLNKGTLHKTTDVSNTDAIVEAVLATRTTAEDVAAERATLPETAQQKFDRIVAKALAHQKAEQDARFWKEVDAKVKERIPKDLDEARQTVRDYTAKLKGIAGHLAMDDYRFLLRILHPDRTPDDAERAKGFAIVSKLDGYMRASTK